MSNGEVEVEEPRPVAVAPQSYAEFFSLHYPKILLATFLLLAGLFLGMIPWHYFQVGVGLLVLFSFVIPYVSFFKAKKEIAGVYKPYRPEQENNDLENRVEKLIGGTVRIQRILGEPEFGEKSAEPYTVHFQATHTLQNGVTKPISFKVGLVNRNILSIEPGHSHIEDSVFSWAAFPKHPKVGMPPKLIYKVRSMPIKPIVEVPEEEEEEEEEEE